MKHTIFASILFIVIMVSGCVPEKKVSPLKDAVQVWNFAGNKGLKLNGSVLTGVKLDDKDKAASIERGGDGFTARFDGGWLDAGQGTNNSLNFGEYGFTLHIRLRVPDMKWDKPIISKHGGKDKLAWQLYGYQYGSGDSIWENTRQNYLSYSDSSGNGYALEFELGVQPHPGHAEYKKTPDPGSFRVGVPIKMIGAKEWHDVTVRFSGASLELFVDGVLVDEEWPIGKLRISPAPCLIGAAQIGDQLVSGFNGEIACAAVWNRAISDEELIMLSGGIEKVAKADLRILGPDKTSLQYWRPRYHNSWVGDVMPIYNENDGRFHVYYLFDRRHHGSKWGVGAHQFAHVSTTDLVNWAQHPIAFSITRQWEVFGTGCPLIVGNHFEMHYGLHTTRMFHKNATVESSLYKILEDNGTYSPITSNVANEQWPITDVPIGHTVAVSNDGINFQKTDTILTPSQNMGIFLDQKSGQYLMIWNGELLTSSNLRNWKPSGKILPTYNQTPANNTGECPNYFEWNNWYYVLMGRSGFWISRDVLGPFWEGINGENKGKVQCARWGIYDGLMVPMVTKHKNNRRILMGFAPYPGHGEDWWGGYLVFRELIQYEDGTLGMKWPEEMIPHTGEPINWKITSATDSHTQISDNEVSFKSSGFASAEIAGLPLSYRVTTTVVPGLPVRSFGMMLKGDKNYLGGCELQLQPDKNHAQWGTPADGAPAGFIAHVKDSYQPNAPYKGWDFALENVEGLNKPFTLDIIVKYDPTSGVTLADACIDGRRTMITNRFKLKGNSLYFFTTGGKVTFRDIKIRPLLE